MFQEFRPILLELSVPNGVPHLNRDSPAEEVINVPMRIGGRFQVVLNPGPQAPGTVRAANIRIETGDEVKSPEPSYLEPLCLAQAGQQNVRAFVFRQLDVHRLGETGLDKQPCQSQ